MEGQPTEKVKIPLDKRALARDLIAFVGIVLAYGFISLTTRVDIFEHLLGFNFTNQGQILSILWAYAIFITIFKIVLILVRMFEKPVENQIPLSFTMVNTIETSLFRVLLITTVALVAFKKTSEGNQLDKEDVFEISHACHMAIWLMISQLNRFASLFASHFLKISEFGLFGDTMEAILILINLGFIFGVDSFAFL